MLMFQEKNSTVHELIRQATRSVYNTLRRDAKKIEIQKKILTQNVDNSPKIDYELVWLLYIQVYYQHFWS